MHGHLHIKTLPFGIVSANIEWTVHDADRNKTVYTHHKKARAVEFARTYHSEPENMIDSFTGRNRPIVTVGWRMKR